MIRGQIGKVVAITPPAAIVDNAAFVTAAIDTAGFKHCQIVVFFGAMDIAMAALKVQESDASNMSGAADVAGLVMGTSTNIDGSASTLPSATADNLVFIFEVDLRGRKRYLDLVATGGDGTAGTYMTAFAILSGGEETGKLAAGRGASQVLRV